MKHFKFFQNKRCEFFPCHKEVEKDSFNCLFCYCPLYLLGNRCGGNFKILDNGIKDCSECIKPHCLSNYDAIIKKITDIITQGNEQ